MHPGQHPCHRGQAPAGVLGVLTTTSSTTPGAATQPAGAFDRRGEAHLWLLLEEALAAARHAHLEGDTELVEETRRRFGEIANALVDVGAVARPLARHIASELAVALSVRGFLSASYFHWSEPPPIRAAGTPVRQRGDGWLEAMIEQHLNLIVDLPPSYEIGERVMANLAPQVRALRAVGSLRSARRLDDLAATLAATGYAADAPPKGEVDKGWRSFLESRPRPLTHLEDAATVRELSHALGRVDGGEVTLTSLAWSTDVLEATVTMPTHLTDRRWQASAFDDSGQLHLGLPGVRSTPATMVFALRPGVRDTARTLSLRVTHEANRLEEQVNL